MKLTYTPSGGGAAQVWEFDLKQFTMGELKTVKKLTGIDGFVPLGQGVEKLDPDALCALVWLLRKRHGEPTLPYGAVDFAIGDLVFSDDDEPDPKEDEEASANQASTNDAGG